MVTLSKLNIFEILWIGFALIISSIVYDKCYEYYYGQNIFANIGFLVIMLLPIFVSKKFDIDKMFIGRYPFLSKVSFCYLILCVFQCFMLSNMVSGMRNSDAIFLFSMLGLLPFFALLVFYLYNFYYVKRRSTLG